MKVSLKLVETHQTQTQNPVHFKAKIPITVFSLPFLSGFSATHSTTADNLSLSLRTHFLSGPSLKLSYNTITGSTGSTGLTPGLTPGLAASAPLTLTLKSGVGLFGSPNNSPLIISANFSFSPNNYNRSPSFRLELKPRFGSFSLRKSVSSVVSSSKKIDNNGGVDGNGNGNSYGFVPLDRGINWKDLRMESGTKESILSGVLMVADTEMPVSKRVKVNLRWGVNIPGDFEKQLPYLRVNKIKIERVDVKEEDDRVKKNGSESGLGEFEVLKGMYAWMSSELSDLRNENREMRRALEDFKLRPVLRKQDGFNNSGGKRVVNPSVVENSDGFEQWRMKKNGGGGEGNGMKEIKKNCGSVDVESELQRAIKAASSSS